MFSCTSSFLLFIQCFDSVCGYVMLDPALIGFTINRHFYQLWLYCVFVLVLLQLKQTWLLLTLETLSQRPRPRWSLKRGGQWMWVPKRTRRPMRPGLKPGRRRAPPQANRPARAQSSNLRPLQWWTWRLISHRVRPRAMSDFIYLCGITPRAAETVSVCVHAQKRLIRSRLLHSEE